jgi:ABC-type nitrate/sulfonate/bicarbonate transport system ATPase subunit
METLIDIIKLDLSIENQSLLKGFDFSISKGKRIGITGPSGCGKTTLLRSIISGKFPDNSEYDKFEIQNINRIGYLPQSDGLLPWFTVRKNLNIYSYESSNANEIIKNLEIENCVDNFPNEISGGENQRALLCCSILSKPDLFIADEPLTEVDLEKKWKILEYWSKTISDSKASLILISHDVDTLTYLCDEIILLSEKPSRIIKTISNNTKYPRKQKDIVDSKVRKEIFDSILKND